MSNLTLDYYNQNYGKFVEDTVNAGMSEIRDGFLKLVKPGGLILDLGCGSGRDSKAFLEAGYKVRMVDGSAKLAEVAEALTGEPVQVILFQDYHSEEMFDGIWACASLLHLPKNEIRDVVSRLAGNLKPGAVFYMSFKYGDYSGERNGRFFTDMTEDGIQEILKDVQDLEYLEDRTTGDVRPGRNHERWLNVILKKRR